MRFAPYNDYKPSGVEWLGDVPAHWEVRRLKRICRLAYGDSLSSENRVDGNVPVYGATHIQMVRWAFTRSLILMVNV